jgi:hypothetical protein
MSKKPRWVQLRTLHPALQFYVFFNWAHALALQWDPSKPSTIGSPLRIGSHPHCQEFDELAEVMNVLLTCLTAFAETFNPTNRRVSVA